MSIDKVLRLRSILKKYDAFKEASSVSVLKVAVESRSNVPSPYIIPLTVSSTIFKNAAIILKCQILMGNNSAFKKHKKRCSTKILTLQNYGDVSNLIERTVDFTLQACSEQS